MPHNIDSKNLIPFLEKALHYAKYYGADQVEVSASYATGLITTVRKSIVESLENTQDKSISINVYCAKHKGSSTTSDFSDNAIKLSVERACEIAKFTSKDEYAGLLDIKYLTSNNLDLDLYHPWRELTTAKAIRLASECESGALSNHQISNSEGATIESYNSIYAQANSHGFMHQTRQSRHCLSLSLIAKSKSGNMQCDHSYTNSRDYRDLWSAKSVAKSAVSRTLEKLNPKKIKTGNYPVIFTPEMARTLIGSFLSAISGMSQYKKTSFLLNATDKLILPKFMHIEEKPLIKKGLASQCYDADGMPLQDSLIIKNGILQRYLLSAYSARALKLEPTGNAGGISNIFVSHTNHSSVELVKLMHKGIIVSEMMGQGVNALTGDYSRGASGFWVENGEIQYPIEEFTIAGNLKEMFKNIIALSNDIDQRSSINIGSLLIENMHIAGGQ